MWNELKMQWKQGGILVRLILVNAGVFVVMTTLQLLVTLSGGQPFPLDEALGLATTWNPQLLMERPWTILTHMFVHMRVWHLVINLALLYWMGRLFMIQFGSRRLLSTYIVGGLAGFVLYFVATNVFPALQQGQYAYGASAAVMAIFVAAATKEPERPIGLILLGSVPLKYVAIGFVLLDYFALSNGENMGGNLAHLGGALFGFLMVRQQRNGRDLVGWFERLLDAIISLFQSRSDSKMRMEKGGRFNRFSKKKKRTERKTSRAQSDDEFNAQKQERESRMDGILDKISKHGYDNLSKEEKAFLFNESNRG